MIYFPGGPADIETTEGTLLGEAFYFPAAVHMHNVARRVSLRVEHRGDEATRLDLNTRRLL